MNPAPPSDSRRRRLGRQLLWLGLGLVLAGLALLFLARPVPLPARLLTGAVDVIAGAVLLVVWNQKFRERGPLRGARVSDSSPASR
ncbi:MAG: hypothetical protein FJ397_00410 [Verrucomicrobia bacterium]|nr:hypothetical protein [Verrucomicrobiota bacterium]